MNLIFNLFIGGFLTLLGAGVAYAVIVNNWLPLLACKRSAIATAKVCEKDILSANMEWAKMFILL
ncbi:MAG: hypothetical protein HC799_00725 [Limnothrix sp. RL_2_0]|nr:hypothetical protein [Limnothrix sp. RL_2_0]